MSILKLFSGGERDIAKFRKVVEQINALEPSIKTLSDEQLAAKTDEFKLRLQEVPIPDDLNRLERERFINEQLDTILVEAFAVVREASIRTLGMPAL